MYFDLRAALRELGPDFALQLINAARPSGEYVFTRFLPEEDHASYYVDGGNMTITPTMAGLSGMDSPYAPGGQISLTKFLENSAKITNRVTLPEAAIRALQELVVRLRGTGQEVSLQLLIDEVLNFSDRVVIQAHIDTFEFLRGQVLNTTTLNGPLNNVYLDIDYQIPESYRPAKRIGADGYGGASSEILGRRPQSATRFELPGRRAYHSPADAST